jgi:putative hemolysin
MITLLVAAALALVAIGCAGALAAADGALLAMHTAPERAGDDSVVRNDRERAHRALAMARVVAYLVAGGALTRVTALPTLSSFVRVAIELGLAIVIVAVTEGAARAVAQARPVPLDKPLPPLTALVVWVFSPVAAIGAALDRALLVVLPSRVAADDERETTADQFREVVAAEAEISRDEEELIHGVFTMGGTQVHEIMVPRVDIVGLDKASPWSEVVDRVRSSEHARLPVFDDTIDNIVGALYAKDLLADVISGEGDEADAWHRLIRPTPFVPTSKRIDAQLREFQANRTHMAIVTDEFGGTAGLLTIEDILEEIVGEIHDEYDEDGPQIEQDGSDRFWVAGVVPLDDIADRLGVDFEVEDVSTVGGLVYELFGRVPRSGEVTTRAGFRIVVERVRRRRVERVYFERTGASAHGKGS